MGFESCCQDRILPTYVCSDTRRLEPTFFSLRRLRTDPDDDVVDVTSFSALDVVLVSVVVVVVVGAQSHDLTHDVLF